MSANSTPGWPSSDARPHGHGEAHVTPNEMSSVPPAPSGDDSPAHQSGRGHLAPGSDPNLAHVRETIAKRTIAERIAEIHGLGQVQTLLVIQAFLDQIVVELAKGNRLEFRDFGVFDTVLRKARTALNPKTLEKVPVPERTVVKFKVGRLLRDRVEHTPPGSEADSFADDTDLV
jgi:integration host factor subunit beta